MLIINGLIDKLQETFPPNRVVALLTPLIFAPAAGWITAYVAQHFPGLPTFSSAQLVGVFVAGSLIAFGKAYKWLDGWQKHEDHQANRELFAQPPAGLEQEQTG